MAGKNEPAGRVNAAAGPGMVLRDATAPRKHGFAGELAQAARRLAAMGYVCVPLNADRRPMCKAWPDLTADPDATAERFAQPGVAGLAIVTRGLVVIDLDRNHAEGVDGIATFDALRAGRDVPDGPRVRTRRSGLHLWFAAPAGISLRTAPGALGPGIDLKAGRGLATCPPTPGYDWLSPPVSLADLPTLPDWLVELARKPERVTHPPAPIRPFRGDLHPYARAVLTRELAGASHAERGQRNAALYRAARRLGALAAAGHIPAEPLARGLMEAARASGLVADDGEAAAHATIASGLAAGQRNPRDLPDATQRRTRHGV